MNSVVRSFENSGLLLIGMLLVALDDSPQGRIESFTSAEVKHSVAFVREDYRDSNE